MMKKKRRKTREEEKRKGIIGKRFYQCAPVTRSEEIVIVRTQQTSFISEPAVYTSTLEGR